MEFPTGVALMLDGVREPGTAGFHLTMAGAVVYLAGCTLYAVSNSHQPAIVRHGGSTCPLGIAGQRVRAPGHGDDSPNAPTG
ncbi:hypothetical protein R1flu_010325 [Riccia fluitans]|uniref:Uncharacterized protein n=1 Tax=Riccia fluitans TaxID=41844 RepID=A0ABD1Z5K4_9MARC